MNRVRVLAGISLIGSAVAAYLLGFSSLIGKVGNGTVTIYPAAALGLIGALALWAELKQA